MKVSLQWMNYISKQYSGIDLLKNTTVDELVEKIGAQLGAVEEVIDVGKRYEGIYVVEVVSCESHPNADKLKICKINDGRKVKDVKRDSKGLIQVVCGAPNAHKGMMAVWLPPGVVVPSTADKDPLTLEAREIRGEVSNGMLASAHELAISDDHSGIVEIDDQSKPGDNFAETFHLDDYVVDIENKMFTHRPDCFGQLGVAREIAGIQKKEFISPDWYKENPVFPSVEGKKLKLKIVNEVPKLVPRFSAITMSNIEVRPSPLWLQIELARVGAKPINNIVDLTNYFMLLTGQPLHAYDYDKVLAKDSGAEHAIITIRHPKKDEKLTLLGGKQVSPPPEAILIASKTKAIGVGGVMGGADTEVDENTKNIILECANFDMYSIRRTAMELGLFTDAVTRFTKGQSQLQTLAVLAKIVDDITKITNGRVSSQLIDSKHRLKRPEVVKTTPKFINERLGLNLSAQKIAKILENVEFKVMPLAGGHLGVTPPFWRTDIEIAEDVVEEVGRLYGYDHLPLELPTRSLTPAKKSEELEFKKLLRDVLSSAGANELLTYSFIHGDLMKKTGQNPDNAFKIANALSPDLQYYRQSLMSSLLDKVHPNIKAGYGEFAIYEINKTLAKDLIDKDGLPIEEERLALVIATDDKVAKEKYTGAPYYQAKKYLELITERLGIDVVFEPMSAREPKLEVGKSAAAPFVRNRSAYVKTSDGKLLGEIGEFKPSVAKSLKLPKFSAGFELDTVALMHAKLHTSSYVQLPKFPKVSQDITLKVNSSVSYGQIFNLINSQVSKLAKNCQMTLTPQDIFQDEKDKAHKNITLHLEIASYDRTLTAEEVNKILDKSAEVAKVKLGVSRV